VFPERPPLGSWAMALVGVLRGEVDLVAIRLPSACGILLLSWVIYVYARGWMTRMGSLTAATAFATFGQVLGIGRLGESESVFTCFTASALFCWHAGYIRGRSQALVWPMAYGLAALGALTKGPQAPVYLVTVTTAFLMVRRDWKWLFSRSHVLGLATFAAIVCAWLIPFAVRFPESVDDIWAGLASDRFTTQGLFKHLWQYPLETLGCLLPWSPLLALALKPGVRRALASDRAYLQFLLVALAVTYPTVWLAAGARGRYFMPLYPCVALIIGRLVEHCASEVATLADRLVWRRYQRVIGVVTLAAGVALVAIRFSSSPKLLDAQQSWGFLAVWLPAALLAAGVLIWASRSESGVRPQLAVITVAAFLGLAWTGAAINARIHGANDLTTSVGQLKADLPAPGELVSLGTVYHRFAYCYDEPIRQIDWPSDPQDVPEGVTYFCFDRRIGDTEESRATGDGRTTTMVSGRLPFQWETVAEIPCDPVKRGEAHRTVVIGRIRKQPDFVADPGAGPNRPVLR